MAGRNVVTYAAAAEADIETTASPVDEEPTSIKDLKTGVARVWGVRGSPDKVHLSANSLQTISHFHIPIALQRVPKPSPKMVNA